ncbi:MAG: PAS domain-containing sensor histidine kinase [Anaerolineaceae bacterium]|nr:PAS domain-containing sensor histidine kinase [Anaerolineaceae bacterium]
MIIEKVSTSYKPWKNTIFITIGLYIALYIAWLFFGRELAFERFLIGNISMTFTSLVAFAATAWVTTQLNKGPSLQAWKYLSFGLLIWTIADAMRLFSLLPWHTTISVDLLRNFLILLGFLPIWMGLLTYPRIRQITHNQIHHWINITVTTTAVVTLIWIIVIAPLQALNTPQKLLSLAAYLPIADLLTLILLMILFLLSDARKSSGSLTWFSLGIVAYLFSDLTYARLLTQIGYEVGSILDIGWIIGDMLFLFAALSILQKTSTIYQHLRNEFFSRLQSLLPFLSIIALAWYALIEWWIIGIFNALGLWVTFLLSLAMIVRQAMLAGEVSIRQYASLVNSIAEATFVCDENGNLQLINPAFVALTGIQPSPKIAELNISTIFSGKSAWQKLLKEATINGWTNELFLNRPNGNDIPVSLSLRPIHPKEDRRLVIAGTVFDLSEQKQQQGELQKANEQIMEDRKVLEQLNTQLENMVVERTQDLQLAYQQLEQQNITLQNLDQIKSDFVSMVSHELRAPLTNINGGIELLLSSQSQPEGTQHKLQLVQKEINRLTHFVETILDLSALDAGKLPLYPMPLQFDSFIEQFKEAFQHQHQTERIQWQMPIESPLLYVDDHALHSILFHILDNAIKYAPEGDINVTAEAQSDVLVIYIEDQGPGIAEDVLPLLFERFFRPNSQDSQSVYGYGLGLYIVKRLTEAMQGTISVKNREPHGVIFSLSLPLFQEGIEE